MNEIVDPSGEGPVTARGGGTEHRETHTVSRPEPPDPPPLPSEEIPGNGPAPSPHDPDPEAFDSLVGGAVDDLGALAEEARMVEEAATRPADGGRPRRDDAENSFLLAALTLALLLFFGWIAGTTLWDLRRELGILGDRVDRIETIERAARTARDRAALARARAELLGLEDTLPPDLARDATEARRTLDRLSGRLDATR